MLLTSDWHLTDTWHLTRHLTDIWLTTDWHLTDIYLTPDRHLTDMWLTSDWHLTDTWQTWPIRSTNQLTNWPDFRSFLSWGITNVSYEYLRNAWRRWQEGKSFFLIHLNLFSLGAKPNISYLFLTNILLFTQNVVPYRKENYRLSFLLSFCLLSVSLSALVNCIFL